MKKILAVLACGFLAACAQPQPQETQPAAGAPVDSLVPGTIGILAKRTPEGVVVTQVRKAGAAAAVGVRPGDRVLRYNGAPVWDLRQFNRRVLDSPPGSRARLDIERDGRTRSVELEVRELDTMPRV